MLAILLLAAIAALAFMTYQPFHGKGYGAVVVKIPQGASAGDIGDLLAQNASCDSGFFFALRARLEGDRSKLGAGTYTLKKSMPYKEALAALTQAPKAAPTIDVTLPEGPSRRELAPRVRAAGVRGNYVKASARSPLLNPRTYGAPRGTGASRASCSRHVRAAEPDGDRRAARRRAAAELQAPVRQGRPQAGPPQAPLPLRRPHHRLDDRARGARARDRRLICAVIYNRLQQEHPARDRRHAALPPEQLDRPLRSPS